MIEFLEDSMGSTRYLNILQKKKIIFNNKNLKNYVKYTNEIENKNLDEITGFKNSFRKFKILKKFFYINNFFEIKKISKFASVLRKRRFQDTFFKNFCIILIKLNNSTNVFQYITTIFFKNINFVNDQKNFLDQIAKKNNSICLKKMKSKKFSKMRLYKHWPNDLEIFKKLSFKKEKRKNEICMEAFEAITGVCYKHSDLSCKYNPQVPFFLKNTSFLKIKIEMIKKNLDLNFFRKFFYYFEQTVSKNKKIFFKIRKAFFIENSICFKLKSKDYEMSKNLKYCFKKLSFYKKLFNLDEKLCHLFNISETNKQFKKIELFKKIYRNKKKKFHEYFSRKMNGIERSIGSLCFIKSNFCLPILSVFNKEFDSIVSTSFFDTTIIKDFFNCTMKNARFISTENFMDEIKDLEISKTNFQQKISDKIYFKKNKFNLFDKLFSNIIVTTDLEKDSEIFLTQINGRKLVTLDGRYSENNTVFGRGVDCKKIIRQFVKYQENNLTWLNILKKNNILLKTFENRFFNYTKNSKKILENYRRLPKNHDFIKKGNLENYENSYLNYYKKIVENSNSKHNILKIKENVSSKLKLFEIFYINTFKCIVFKNNILKKILYEKIVLKIIFPFLVNISCVRKTFNKKKKEREMIISIDYFKKILHSIFLNEGKISFVKFKIIQNKLSVYYTLFLKLSYFSIANEIVSKTSYFKLLFYNLIYDKIRKKKKNLYEKTETCLFETGKIIHNRLIQNIYIKKEIKKLVFFNHLLKKTKLRFKKKNKQHRKYLKFETEKGTKSIAYLNEYDNMTNANIKLTVFSKVYFKKKKKLKKLGISVFLVYKKISDFFAYIKKSNFKKFSISHTECMHIYRISDFSLSLLTLSEISKIIYSSISLGGIMEFDFLEPSDPYLQGLVTSVRPPNKTWRSVSMLSGGEKTLCSLALIFSLQIFKPTLLYLLDEIDAALDFKNVSKIASHIFFYRLKSQILVISLRNSVLKESDVLVGVNKILGETRIISLKNSNL